MGFDFHPLGSNNAGAPARPPLIPPERYPLYDRLIFLVFVLVLPPLIASTPRLFADGDVSWHVAAGRWILEHGRIPHTDPFSHTMAGQPWVAHEWLAEMLYAAAFDVAGWAGLAAIAAAAIMALHLVVFLFLRRRVGPIAVVAALAAMDVALIPFMLARPHLLVWPLLALWTAALLSARDSGRPPPLWLALAMLVWANLHGSFPLGFAVAGAIAFDALIAGGWRKPLLLGWLSFGLAALLASLVNANGADAFLHPLSIMGMDSLAVIGEWQPSTPAGYPTFYVVLLPVLAAMFVRGARLKLGEAALLLLLLLMAFSQVRHQSWLAIVAALVLPPAIASARADARPLFGWSGDRRWWTVGAAIVALLAVGARAAIPIGPRDGDRYPHRLIAAIPDSLRTQPVLNEYSFGGPLILAGIRPYIDGRADMYGDAFTLDYVAIARGDMDRFRRAVDRYGIRWTIFPDRGALVAALDESREWRRLYADERGVIHVRATPSRGVASAE